MRANSIKNILIVNNDYAEIHLTDEAQKEFSNNNKDESLPWVSAKPVLTYNFGSLENFENIIKENKEKYNLEIDWINDHLSQSANKTYFLCDIDVEWENDPLREHPKKEDRQRLFNLYKVLLEKYC